MEKSDAQNREEELNIAKTMIIEILSAYELSFGEMCGLFRELEIDQYMGISQEDGEDIE